MTSARARRGFAMERAGRNPLSLDPDRPFPPDSA
jgi:hypothetical protein